MQTAAKNTVRILQVQTHVPDIRPSGSGIYSPDQVTQFRESALLEAEKACRKASEEGADMAALPEMFCCPYQAGFFPYFAEPEGGPVWSACAGMAARYGIYLSAGSMPEIDGEGRIYNTAYVFDRSGRQIARHRKMHLFNINVPGGIIFRESDTLSAGDKVTVFETEFGPVGLCICFDFRFPELARLMALRSARLILVPASFNMTTGPAHWELMFRSQAMYQQCFAVGTAPALNESASYRSWGHSIAADPWGNVICQMGFEEGTQLIELDLSEADRIRAELPLLSGRREDVYTLKENAALKAAAKNN